MLRLVLSDDKKHVGIEIEDSTIGKIVFWRQSPSEIEATLLQAHLSGKVDASMEAIRKVSYLRGWRAAKSKRNKESWWSCWPEVLPWEKKEAGL
jgi:hypothetical protein